MIPVTLDALKLHLGITADNTTDNDLLTQKLAAASASVEAFIGYAFDDEETFPDGVPEPLKEAVLQYASHLYENREPVLVGINASEIPMGIGDTLMAFRRWVF